MPPAVVKKLPADIASLIGDRSEKVKTGAGETFQLGKLHLIVEALSRSEDNYEVLFEITLEKQSDNLALANADLFKSQRPPISLNSSKST
jgi:hypothetical protein